MKNSRKKLLITGATGLVGRKLVEIALSEGEWEIFAPVFNDSLANGLPDGCEMIEADMTEPGKNTWMRKFPEKIDSLVHLAQFGQYKDFPGSAEKIFNINTVVTLSLLDYCRETGAKNFVFASTGGVYDCENGRAVCREEDPIRLKDNTPFFIKTKFCSEIIASSYSQFMNVASLRFFFVYGPGQRPGMFISGLVSRIGEGLPLFLDGNDGISLNPVHVNDAAKSVMASIRKGRGGVFNVAGPEILTIREICDEIGKHSGKKPEFTFTGREPQNFIADITKTSEMLHRPEKGFRDGIRQLLSENREVGNNG